MKKWRVEKVKVTPQLRDIEVRLNSIEAAGGEIKSILVIPSMQNEFAIIYRIEQQDGERPA